MATFAAATQVSTEGHHSIHHQISTSASTTTSTRTSTTTTTTTTAQGGRVRPNHKKNIKERFRERSDNSESVNEQQSNGQSPPSVQGLQQMQEMSRYADIIPEAHEENAGMDGLDQVFAGASSDFPGSSALARPLADHRECSGHQRAKCEKMLINMKLPESPE